MEDNKTAQTTENEKQSSKPQYVKPELQVLDVSMNDRVMIFQGTRDAKRSCTTHNHTCGWTCDAAV